MANDPQRDKARSMFGSAFMDAAKAAPPPKNYAAGQQKIAQSRPIPTYKVGGVIDKRLIEKPTRPFAEDKSVARKVPDRMYRGESERPDDLAGKKPMKKAEGGALPPVRQAAVIQRANSPITGQPPGKFAVGGAGKTRKGQAPIKRAEGGAAKVRKGMMTQDGKITPGVKPHKGIG